MTIRIRGLNESLPGDPKVAYDKSYVADTEAEMNSITTPLTDFVCYCVATARFYAYLNSIWAPLALQGESIVEERTADPATPVVGQMWLRTDL